MDPRSTDELAWTLTVRARPIEGLTPRQRKEWERNARRTIVTVRSANGLLMELDAHELYLLGLRDELQIEQLVVTGLAALASWHYVTHRSAPPPADRSE